MEWLRGLVDELKDPAWAAGMLETLVGVAVAGIAALAILRRQLQHDREMALQQRRADAANAYAAQLRAAYDVYMRMSAYTMAEALRTSSEAPGAEEMYRAAVGAEASRVPRSRVPTLVASHLPLALSQGGADF